MGKQPLCLPSPSYLIFGGAAGATVQLSVSGVRVCEMVHPAPSASLEKLGTVTTPYQVVNYPQ